MPASDLAAFLADRVSLACVFLPLVVLKTLKASFGWVLALGSNLQYLEVQAV